LAKPEQENVDERFLELFTMTKTTIKAEQFPGTMRKAWEREHRRVA